MSPLPFTACAMELPDVGIWASFSALWSLLQRHGRCRSAAKVGRKEYAQSQNLPCTKVLDFLRNDVLRHSGAGSSLQDTVTPAAASLEDGSRLAADRLDDPFGDTRQTKGRAIRQSLYIRRCNSFSGNQDRQRECRLRRDRPKHSERHPVHQLSAPLP